jgi:hypothetical protein
MNDIQKQTYLNYSFINRFYLELPQYLLNDSQCYKGYNRKENHLSLSNLIRYLFKSYFLHN